MAGALKAGQDGLVGTGWVGTAVETAGTAATERGAYTVAGEMVARLLAPLIQR